MKNLVTNNLISELRDKTMISYILNDDSLFFEVGYKVLQSQEIKGLIRCYKVKHNGKIKLIYDTSRYQLLKYAMNEISHEDLFGICYKLIELILEIKNIGFLQYEHIDFDIDKIYIDINHLEPILICIPILPEKVKEHSITIEKMLKNNLIDLISDYKANDQILKLYNKLLSEHHSIEDIVINLKSEIKSERSTQPEIKNKVKEKINIEKPNTTYNPVVNNSRQTQASTNTKEHKTAIKAKLSKMITVKKETLNQTFLPSIILTGTNTPVEVEIVVNKPEFVIGSNPETVDSVIRFNKAISRNHCKITYINSCYYLSDLGSSNGTYINKVKLQPSQQVLLNVGDKIMLANSEFLIEQL